MVYLISNTRLSSILKKRKEKYTKAYTNLCYFAMAARYYMTSDIKYDFYQIPGTLFVAQITVIIL